MFGDQEYNLDQTMIKEYVPGQLFGANALKINLKFDILVGKILYFFV